jgi:hypothetical protein
MRIEFDPHDEKDLFILRNIDPAYTKLMEELGQLRKDLVKAQVKSSQDLIVTKTRYIGLKAGVEELFATTDEILTPSQIAKRIQYKGAATSVYAACMSLVTRGVLERTVEAPYRFFKKGGTKP